MLKAGSHYGTRGDDEIMAVMDAPHTEHWAAGAGPWSAARAAANDDAVVELEELFWKLDFGPRHRVELLEGRIVVSPTPVVWHDWTALWLYEQFRDACRENHWQQALASTVILPPTRHIIVPDHLIVKDPDAFPNAESLVPLEHVLLVSEVVSPSSIRADREVKPVCCAKAGIPLYLLVDRFTKPITVTLMSEPGDGGYGKKQSVPAGPGGGILPVPKPFAITIDASTLPAFQVAASRAGG
jgi:Uma2 family endonuclease